MPKRLILLLSLCLMRPAPLPAEWRLVSSKTLSEGAVAHVQKRVADGEKKATLDCVLFDPRSCALRVIDKPGARSTLAGTMDRCGALAGVNGGYFHPDFTPLGLLIANSRTIHPLERAKLLSGMLIVSENRPALLRVAEFKPSAKISDALQAGPFLVDRGNPVPGLNAARIAVRTVVLGDGAGRVALAVCQSATLAETAQILAAPGVVTEMKVTRALNLDGGSSSALWVRGDGRPPYSIREWKSVRNYVAIVPKAK